jgi:antitoxin VapB
MSIEAVNIQNLEGSQAINIPSSLKINDDKVYIKKIGNVLYLIPFHNPWQNFMDSLEDFTPDFMENRNQPPAQSRESFD